MFIKLDMASDKPIYVQLKEQIIEGIASGELKPGDSLPSVRALASDVGVNLHTVNKVYQQLKLEEYIQIHRSRGVMINPNGFAEADESYYTNLKEALRPLIADVICHGLHEQDFADLTLEVYQQILGKAGEANE